MKKVLFLILFFIAGNACFAQKLTGKNYQDSVLTFLQSDNLVNPQADISRALSDKRSTDSLNLILYQLRQKYLIETKGSWEIAKAIIDQGIILEHLGADSSLVLQKFKEAYYYAQENDNPNYMLWAAIRLSKHYLNIGVLNTADELKYYNEVNSKLSQKSKSDEIWYLGYNYLANRYLRFYDFKTALEFYNKSYQLAKAASSANVLAEVGTNILEVYNKNNDTIGVKNLASSFENEIPKNNYALRGWFYLRLAGFNNLFNQKTRANYLQLADEYYKISDDKTERNLLLLSFCKYYEETGNIKLLRKYLDDFRKELKITPPTQLYYYSSQIELLEGQYFDLLGDYPQAIDFYKKSLAKATEIDAPVLLPTIYNAMYETAGKYKDYENAYLYLTEYNAHQDAVFSLHKTKEIQDLIVHYEADKKQLTINNLEKESALNEQILEEKTNTNFILQLFLLVLVLLSVLMVYLYVLNRIKSKKLTQLNKLKDTVFSVLSHDLRSPLNTFKSLLAISHRKSLSTEQYKKYLEVIETEVSNTSMFLDNLLQWAQANQNQHPVIKEEIDVCKLLATVKSEIDLDLRAKRTQLNMACQPGIVVISDRALLGFIVRNIAFNAVKFSSKNAEVFISVSKNEYNTTIEIKDHGKGMTPQAVEEFYKGKLEASLDATGEKSTGLGLGLCREFAHKIGVTINLKSELDKGSVFSVVVPR